MASNVATPLERQFSLIPGISQMTSVSSLGSTSITLQFELTQNINTDFEQVQAAINAASAQLPDQSAERTHPARGQSVRRADHDPVAQLRHPAAGPGRQLRRRHPVAADLAHRRRRPGHHRRPAEAGGPHPDRSAQDRRPRPADRQRARADRRRHRQRAQGRDHRPAAKSHRLRQRPDPGRCAVERSGGRLSATARAVRIKDLGERHPGRREQPDRRLGLSRQGQHRSDPEGRPEHPADHLQDARRQRHQDGGPDHQGACRACRPIFRRPSTSTS